jgi:hypothetical protein
MPRPGAAAAGGLHGLDPGRPQHKTSGPKKVDFPFVTVETPPRRDVRFGAAGAGG